MKEPPWTSRLSAAAVCPSVCVVVFMNGARQQPMQMRRIEKEMAEQADRMSHIR